MKNEIVVASYRETLQWVPMLSCINHELERLDDCKITVYRTGSSMEGAIMLENKGREAGQWLEHIARNYDQLADLTFFVQADLGPSFGRNGDQWPHDLNLLKSFHAPPRPDRFSFYTWPGFDRIRCSVIEPGMTEHEAQGHAPENPAGHKFSYQASLLWGDCPAELRFPKIHMNAFFGAQHVLTKEFIRRLPLDHYKRCLNAVKQHELAHWLEFGNWPVFIYDIYRQGPLS